MTWRPLTISALLILAVVVVALGGLIAIADLPPGLAAHRIAW